ncbi:MAG TPA: hypothetical protein VH089_23950 [Streptosporangiaceae bacterium]|nr:hypothetical protein [Streptosporangiaceae bacterium]
MLVAAAAALLEMPPFLPSVVAGVILFGVSVPWLVVGFTTPQTISIAAGAALIGVTGYRPLLAALAAVVTLAAAYLLTRPEQRRAPSPTPAPAPQAAGGSTSS